MAEATPDRFEVLIVCTGNVCRSPVVEQVLRARFGESVARFSSAGTYALVGAQMPEQAQELSRQLGADPAVLHAPRQLEAQLIERADLVLALTREHRAEIVRALPRANRCTVTLREAARLLESLAADPEAQAELARLQELSALDALRAAVPLVMAQRGFAGQPATPDDDDVVDPYRRPQQVYDASGRQIADAIDRIERVVRTFAERQ